MTFGRERLEERSSFLKILSKSLSSWFHTPRLSVKEVRSKPRSGLYSGENIYTSQ